ncbi:MAG TPA: lysylphosphatidylglycerol synthase transmembrane domain-containing protein [Gemmatimonadaceae bacterium]|nr:lysylphosphatidylglycerol synthase transmembrane domain-containing protein [Gemmatimonadaceae bacterium]
MKFNWKSAVGILLSVALLIWTLRGVSIGEVWAELERSNLLLFFLAATAATLIFPLRAIRWKIILAPVQPGIPIGPLWRSIAIGMMVNNLVPARAGEIARAYALTKETKISFASSLASLAVDRLFDMVVLLGLGVAAVFSPDFPRGATVGGQSLGHLARGSVVLVIALVGALYMLAIFPSQLVRAFEIFARRVSPTVEERGKNALLKFSAGLSVLKSPTRFALVLFWTIVHWLMNAFAFWLGFRAVGIQLGFMPALFLQLLIGIGVALPSAPGFFGVFEKLATVGLAIYGIAATAATSWAIGFHILSFIPITVIGIYYFSRLGLSFRELRTTAESPG